MKKTTIERLHQTGILRLGTPKSGFRYGHADGSRVTVADLERIQSLTIPPAWKDVAINAVPGGRVQVVGNDAAGRWQYLYHEKFSLSQDRRKFRRLISFGEKLPQLRRTITSHLRERGLSRHRVLAAILRVLSTSFMRSGSDIYASENGSYGIATLRRRHVTVKGDQIMLDFPGKSGVRQQREIRDRTVARIVRELLAHPNRRVFKYQNDEGNFVDITGREINAYIKEVMGRHFSAKDFRTWAGTLVCACMLAQRMDEGVRRPLQSERKIKEAIKVTAEVLGNTPAVCRKAYVCPEILTSFTKGEVISCCVTSLNDVIGYRAARLHAAERALLKLLKKSNGKAH